MQLAGASAIVTGGGSGLGAATAEALAAAGAKVVVFDIDAAKAEAVAQRLGGIAVAGDVAEEAPLRAAADRAGGTRPPTAGRSLRWHRPGGAGGRAEWSA